MRYLILDNEGAFYTNWFDYNSHYMKGQIVFDLHNNKFTKDGVTWIDILEDTL